MDPASLGLGVVSLTVQLFYGLVKAFDIFESAARASQESEQCKLFLRIEYERLEQWAMLSRLDTDKPSPYIRRNGTLTVYLLSQLDMLLKSLRKRALNEYSGDTQPPGPLRIAQASVKLADISDLGLESVSNAQQTRAGLDIVMRLPDASLKKRSFLEGVKERIELGARDLKQVAKHPKSFKWAIRDKGEFKRDLDQVRQLVDALTDMLSTDQMANLLESTNSFKLMLLQIATNVTEMKLLLKEGQAIGDDTAQSISGATLIDDSSWAAATEFSIEASNLDPASIKPLDPGELILNGHDTTGTLRANGNGFWVEWKTMASSPSSTTAKPTDVQDRMKKLVALLQLRTKPKEFCAPNCVGYLEQVNKERIGLVFELPSHRNGSGRAPLTLRKLYESHRGSLALRTAIAQKLSQWLLYLQAVNWLHKGLRSESVVFFDENVSKDSELQVAGFESSRAAADSKNTTGPDEKPERLFYTHPDYFESSRPFTKSDDLYSLGVILVELAYWKPIEEIMGIVEGSTQRIRNSMTRAHTGVEASGTTLVVQAVPGLRGRVRNIRKNLLDDKQDYLRHLEDTMGERYCEATITCLTGLAGDAGLGLPDDSDQTDPSVGAMMQQAFVERVVDPLKGIIV